MTVSTLKGSIRDKIQGWGVEDANQVHIAFDERLGTEHEYDHPNKVPVGLIRSGNFPLYPTVLHALGDGWKLLAPPTQYDQPCTDDDGAESKITLWEWWLVKD